MNKKQWMLGVVALVLIAGTGGLLAELHAHQRLGAPGVKTHPLAGSTCLQVDLPERVLDYTSESLPLDEITTNTLPKDTSFGQRFYVKLDRSFAIQARVVLMGTDRASMHKPQFCLEGQGWHIYAQNLSAIPIQRPSPYDLPVVKIYSTKDGLVNGRPVTARGVYVYWYVADDALSASVSGAERMWLLAKKMLLTGVLQRWAYVSCFAECLPGQEDATFERMKQFIASSTPEFQLYHPHTAPEPAPSRL